MESEHVVCDLSPERKAWIFKYAHVLQPEDIADICVAAEEEELGRSEFVRVIQTEDGIIVDQSHDDLRSWTLLGERLDRGEGSWASSENNQFLPVILHIMTLDELDVLKDSISRAHNLGLAYLASTELGLILKDIDEGLHGSDDDDAEDEDVSIGA